MKLYLLLLSFLIFASVSCQKTSTQEAAESLDATTVRVYKDALENLKLSTASTTDFPDVLPIMGKVSITEDRTTVIPARVTGRLESILFASGEFVRQGQVLATLFSPDYISAKEEYLQALKQTKSAPSKADPADFENLATLAKKKLETMGLSQQDILSLQQDSTREIASVGSPHPLLNVRSPRNGIIIAKTAVLGNLVNVGDTLFTIGDMSKVWFSGDLYPEDLPRVKKNQEVFIKTAGMAKPVQGVVSFISPMVDPVTRSIKIRALMDNPDLALKSDMYVQGSMILERKKALLVPITAVVRTPDGDVVFKRMNPTIEKEVASVDFKKIPVQIGVEREGVTSVLSGLSDGDQIVSDGAWLLDGVLKGAGKK